MDLQRMTADLEPIRKAGARGAELLYIEDKGHVVTLEGGRASRQHVEHERRVHVRVWVEGGRAGQAVGDPGDLPDLAAQALLAAASADEDPHHGPMPRLAAVPGGLSIRDRRFEQLTAEDRADVLVAAHQSVRQANKRLEPAGFRYRDRLRVRRFVNTKGVALEEFATSYVAEGEVAARAPEGSLRVSDTIATRSFASIASLPYGTALARRVLQLLDDRETLPDGPVRVLLPARAVAQLIAAVAEGFVAASFADGGAFFLRPEGSAVVDGRLHLVDDGTLPGGLRSRSFDDRGVAPVALTLLREGQVDGRFIGAADARRLDVRPTGHMIDGALEPSNLILKSGTRSVNATLSDLGGPSLQVDALADLSGLDRATGDLEVRVHGVVMRANLPVGAMRGVTLRGNLLSVLGQVVEVCSDTDRVGHVDAPALIVDGFVLTAGG